MTIVAGALGGGAVAVVEFSAALVVFALGETLLAPSQAAPANDLAPDDLRGRYNGLYSLAWTTGFAVGQSVVGVALGAGNGTTLFGGLIVACGLAAVAAARLARHLRQRSTWCPCRAGSRQRQHRPASPRLAEVRLAGN